MRLFMLSVNHQVAPVTVREKLALSGERFDAFATAFRQHFPSVEFVVLSTCNRTEIYLARPSHEAPSFEQFRHVLGEICGLDLETLVNHSVYHESEGVVRHLFRVAAGLESMVLGEPQILGQIRRAYEAARDFGSVGPVLNCVFQHCMSSGKAVRARTGIGDGRVSVASVAVDFAEQIFETFCDKTVLGIGAGEATAAVLRRMRELGPKRLMLSNRSRERAEALAAAIGLDPDRGEVHDFTGLGELLVEADIVISGTGATEPIITDAGFRPLLRRRHHRPLLMVDIAVPRDIDPAVGRRSNVYLYDLDDLGEVMQRTQRLREGELAACEQLLEDGVTACMSELKRRRLAPLIRQFRGKMHAIAEQEQARAARKLEAAGVDPATAADLLQEHHHRLMNKILHLPMSRLNSEDAHSRMGFYAAALKQLFHLDEPDADTMDAMDADCALDALLPEPAEEPTDPSLSGQRGNDPTA